VKLQGRPIAATITRRADRWFASLTVERERDVCSARPVAKSTHLVGVDLGLTNAAVIHDGSATRVLEAHRFLRRNLEKVRTGLGEAGSVRTPPRAANTQRRVERPVGAGLYVGN
jgi:putative transposase